MGTSGLGRPRKGGGESKSGAQVPALHRRSKGRGEDGKSIHPPPRRRKCAAEQVSSGAGEQEIQKRNGESESAPWVGALQRMATGKNACPTKANNLESGGCS